MDLQITSLNKEDLLSKKLEINEEFINKTIDLLENILDNEHSERGKKQVKTHTDRLQYACPYCGDSSKNSFKKRGNLYWDSLQMHCFNSGCPSPHVSLITFLTDFGISRNQIQEIYGSYTLIRKHIKDNTDTSSFTRTRTDNSVRGDVFLELEKHGILLEDFKKLTNSASISPTSKAYKYLKGRLQHKNLDKVLTSKKGLLLLNLNSKKDRVVGFQIKTFSETAPYLTYDIQRIYQELLGQKLKTDDPVIIERMNIISTYFNIMYARLTGKLTIFEGPFDSFLFQNSIATCTAGRDSKFLQSLPNIQYMYDNDKAGNTYAYKQLMNGQSVFIWTKFLEEHNIEKDIKDYNDLLLFCYKNKSKAYQNVDNYFSNYKHDSFYLKK